MWQPWTQERTYAVETIRVSEPGGVDGLMQSCKTICGVQADAMMGELEELWAVFQHTQEPLGATLGKVEYNRQPGRMYKTIQVDIIQLHGSF